LSVAAFVAVSYFDPAVLEERFIIFRKPGDASRGILESVIGIVAIWQCYIKWVLFRLERAGPEACAAGRVVEAAEVLHPFFIPIALVVRDIAVIAVGRLPRPEKSRHGALKVQRWPRQRRGHLSFFHNFGRCCLFGDLARGGCRLFRGIGGGRYQEKHAGGCKQHE